MGILDPYRDALKGIEDDGLLRSLSPEGAVKGPQKSVISIGEEGLLNFSSNNYLGLANHRGVVEALAAAALESGVGSGAARLVSGDMTAHRALEARLDAFLGRERTLLFNSGYHANTGVLPALVGRGDEILADKLVHASLIDGARLSRATIKRYPHRDMNALEKTLASSNAKKKLIVTDAVFSMDGTVAPLKDILALAQRYDSMVYLDDAHGFGVLGPGGRGTAELLGITPTPRLVTMATLGKAIGTYGAFVNADAVLIDFLINRARTFVFSTSLPPAICAASIKALDIAEAEPQRRERVLENARYLREGLLKSGLEIIEGDTHIVPLIVGEPDIATELSRKLYEKNFFAQAIRPPTVPDGTARLRLTLTADITKSDIDSFVTALTEIR